MSISLVRTAILCDLQPPEESICGRTKNIPAIPRLRSSNVSLPSDGKILLQPRICTLRSYGSGSIRSPANNSGTDPSLFFSSLADYVDSARKSHDFEVLSGRIAMIAFATALGVEFLTGNALFKKLDLREIAGAAGVCLAVVSSAAVFARLSSNRAVIGQMLTLSCNAFVDSIVDNIIEGLFYENQLSDWSDEM